MPAFARPDAEAPWRPDRALLADHRAGRLIGLLGDGDLETLQARAVADPAWFWGAAVEDLEVAWQRPWDRVLDLRDGPELPRWWSGGAFDHAAAVNARWSSRDRHDAIAVDWEGDDGVVRALTGGELAAAVESAADRFAAQ